ncbi:hypothetical protein LTR17_011851 [Elasticomyces elasticus]|nr:hypothetical protein LTR17_011851 [Elasticomyces elasticus]
MSLATTTTPRAMPLTTSTTKAPTINILLTSFAGLGLPRTLSLPISPNTPISSALSTIYARLPQINHPLLITTTNNKQLLASSTDPVSSLLTNANDAFLPLRLSVRLCGGKGGFGSQLRAAGGRMSSRKKRNNEDPNGSNRNLDGRRLRTINEAKKLAEYLATKPDMDKKEREERKKRWEDVVAAAERKEEEVRSGKAGHSQGRLDAEYVESKEVAEEKTREAVIRAMREQMMERTGSESSAEVEGGSGDEEVDGSEESSSEDAETEAGGASFFGWDEEDDEDEDEEGEADVPVAATAPVAYTGKGKGKAV